MKSRLRLILFLSALLIFLLGGAYLVIYAQGWVLNFNNLTIVQTGGLYLNYTPSNAILKINGKITSVSADFLTGGRLIKNFLPNDYHLSVTKDGYTSWQKDLPVKSGFVTAETHIKLWPLEPATVAISAGQKISDFWLTNQGLVSKTSDGTIIFQNKILRGNNVILADPGSNYIITSQNQTDFITDLKTPNSSLNLNDLFNSLKQQNLHYPGFVPIKSVFFHPFNADKLILTTQNSVYDLNLNRIKLTEILRTENILNIVLANNEVFALNKNNQVWWANLILGSAGLVNLSTSSIVKTLVASPDGNHWLLKDVNSNVFSYNGNSNVFHLIEKNADTFNFSPDSQSAILTDKSGNVTVFYPEEYNNDFHLPAMTTIDLNLPDSKTTGPIAWLTLSNHFLVLKDGNLIASEIDPYPPLNFSTLATNVKKYEVNGNDLYILKTSGELLKMNLNQ